MERAGWRHHHRLGLAAAAGRAGPHRRHQRHRRRAAAAAPRRPRLAACLRDRPADGRGVVDAGRGRCGGGQPCVAVAARAGRLAGGRGHACRFGLHQRPRRVRAGPFLAALAGGGAYLHGDRDAVRLRLAPPAAGADAVNRLLAWLSGLLFGVGLAWSGMADPHEVLGFLDVAGAWDPSLLLVMAGATLTYAVGSRLVTRRARPWLDERFHLPANRRIDARLLAGAAVFGIGWLLPRSCAGWRRPRQRRPHLVAAGLAAGLVAGRARPARLSPSVCCGTLPDRPLP